ncbi:MAG: hypothetical protein IH873_02315 [Chloroflexi bacterium]|nr:hypothetical protein [Chloroflexota bacterium]
MNNELEKFLLEFLAGEKSLDDVRDWVAMNIWTSPAAEGESVIDQLAIELAHLDDGSADEQYFRTAVSEFLGIYSFVVNEWQESTSTATNDIYNSDSALPEDPIRVGPVFA